MAFNADQPPQSLADSIAGATRKAHSTLNKLIIARLPDALPPRAADPSSYISGLLHIAPVYIQFEALWQSLLNTSPAMAPTGSIPDACDPSFPILDNGGILTPQNEGIKVHRPLVCDRIHSLLEHLQLPALMRSGQLRADLRALTQWPNHEIEEQLRTIQAMGPLADFLNHMKRSVENKPHVLVAYAYIFYMALFAGGRFIRAGLKSAGPEFWTTTPSPIKPTMRGCEPVSPDEEPEMDEGGMGQDHKSPEPYQFPLRFFHFSTPLDGEDLKKEFKERLADSETILTTRERVDIVRESIAIFDHMTLLVGQLHVTCAGSTESTSKSSSGLLGLPSNLLMARLRDSMAVAKDRRSARKLPNEATTASEGGYDLAVQGTSHPPGKSSSEGDTQLLYRSSTMPADPAAMPKSVRFERALPQPDRKLPDSFDGTSDIAELAGSIQLSRHRPYFVRWVLALVFGVVMLGAQVVWRRSSIELGAFSA